MTIQLFDENNMRQLPDEERFEICNDVLRNETDESKRWDAVWLVGELAEDQDDKNLLRNRVADLLEWVLRNDTNGVVKHEASFQIAARNLRHKIHVLTDIALNDKSVLSKHEAIEALGLMRAFEIEDEIKKALDDPSIDVRETAEFVLKRFDRLRNSGEYKPSDIL
ncbi:HEAT repeat domain-containing protein [Nitrosopumilus piranensis]|uniref:PBS lyase HEAT domain protein repeat-containing protein n=1 Tax=Nitrosopumilus piranensis TaxID=1582439 RepID=A0A0C5BVA6_9ARCH|nr:HEAT repeat domain-containing protein [Nitrosopumilus piranensis]AJM92154.1 PBS lyase HEAT domain protein repeat-containing protein [Nitrosopumilus piranensis]